MTLVARFGVGYNAVDVAACTEHGHRRRDHAGWGSAPRRRFGDRPAAGAHRQDVRKGPPDADGPGRLRAAKRAYGRRPGRPDNGPRSASAISASKRSGWQRRSDCVSSRTIPMSTPSVAADLNVSLVDLDTVFREFDFVSLNCPLTPQTTHLVNERRIALMKPSSFLINTATRRPDRSSRPDAGAQGDAASPAPGSTFSIPSHPQLTILILGLDNVILGPPRAVPHRPVLCGYRRL